MRGLDISAIGIIALLAVIMMAVYLINTTGTGSERAGQSVYSTSVGQNIELLENVKGAVNQDLKFSASQASIVIAAQGGSPFPLRYWMCNEQVTVPQPDEVLFALSNTTGATLAGYMNATKQYFGNISIRGYKCSGIYDPGQDACLSSSSQNCESFSSSAEKGEIKVSRQANLSYTGKLEAEIGANRFWWIYYNLKDFFESDGFRDAIKQNIAKNDNCEQPTKADMTVAIDEACKKLASRYDKYVEVKCDIVCQEEGKGCLNEDCMQPEIDTSVCFDKKLSAAGKDESFIYGEQQYLNKISAQSASLGSVIVQISIKDTKYNIAGPNGDLVPLIWNARLVAYIGEALCTVVFEEKV